jgi:hypothetical protein
MNTAHKSNSFVIWLMLLMATLFAIASFAQTPPKIHSFSTNRSTDKVSVNTLASVPAGALLVLTVAQSDDIRIPNPDSVYSVPALQWVKRQDFEGVELGNAEIYTAVFPAGGSITTRVKFGPNAVSSVLYAVTGYDPNNIFGATAGAPSGPVTYPVDSCLLIGVVSDWDAIIKPPAPYLNNATEQLGFFEPQRYTAYFFSRQLGKGWTTNEGMAIYPPGTKAGSAFVAIPPVPPSFVKVYFIGTGSDTLSPRSKVYNSDTAAVISRQDYYRFGNAYYEMKGSEGGLNMNGEEYLFIFVVRRVTLTTAQRNSAYRVE